MGEFNEKYKTGKVAAGFREPNIYTSFIITCHEKKNFHIAYSAMANC